MTIDFVTRVAVEGEKTEVHSGKKQEVLTRVGLERTLPSSSIGAREVTPTYPSVPEPQGW